VSTAEKIYELVQRLPPLKQMEVFDFASYLEQRNSNLSEGKPSLEQLRGVLKDSKIFSGNAVDMQRTLRDEWD